MDHKETTTTQRILANKMAYRSQGISSEILRVAKQKAEETHRAALLAQETYNREHGTNHQISSARQRD